jgi:hypothetical protein
MWKFQCSIHTLFLAYTNKKQQLTKLNTERKSRIHEIHGWQNRRKPGNSDYKIMTLASETLEVTVWAEKCSAVVRSPCQHCTATTTIENEFSVHSTAQAETRWQCKLTYNQNKSIQIVTSSRSTQRARRGRLWRCWTFESSFRRDV